MEALECGSRCQAFAGKCKQPIRSDAGQGSPFIRFRSSTSRGSGKVDRFISLEYSTSYLMLIDLATYTIE